MRIFYFGCRDRPGQFSWEVGKQSCRYDDVVALIGEQLDATLAPQRSPFKHAQGAAALVYRNEYTILAWWDMTADRRPNSNSALIVEGELGFDAMLALLPAHFPDVAARQTVPITIPRGGR